MRMFALEQQDFSDEERVDIAQLKREKYCTHEWIFQTTAVPDSTGSARKKTPAGLLDVRVAMAGRIIKALYLCGDFFVAENTIADIEAHLKWHSSEPDDIEKTLQTVHRKHAVELEGMPMRALKSVILAAVENASAQKMQPKQSYGCFIKPDAMVA